MQLQNGILFPLPVCLDISDIQAKTLETGQSVALRDPEGFLLEVMHIDDMWPVDPNREVEMVYGTLDREHPGVDYLYSTTGEYYIGGSLEALSLPLHF